MDENIKKSTSEDWDQTQWLKLFQMAKETGDGFRVLRAAVYKNTVEIVNRGFYDLDGKEISIENSGNILSGTKFYSKPDPVKKTEKTNETTISVINIDCLKAAEELIKDGFEPAVLNMANRQNPGGGVVSGGGAQEENIFRRSNLFVSLYQFADQAAQYGIPRSNEHSYPLNRDTGGIYSPDVSVFRSSESSGYALSKQPFKAAFITVPAINSPELVIGEDSLYRIAPHLTEPTREKIRTILRIALNNGHECIVLGAFGCGAFRNPPGHMAQLFREVFNEDEFSNSFRKVVFAIIDDHNARKSHNPHGNFEPFRKMFEQY
jgi:uncharacterized protein (TIGR02452 family)